MLLSVNIIKAETFSQSQRHAQSRLGMITSVTSQTSNNPNRLPTLLHNKQVKTHMNEIRLT